jgi:hypothetical protein
MIGKIFCSLTITGYLLFRYIPAYSQEFLIPAPVVEPGSQQQGHHLKAVNADTLELPFFDDFSKDRGYPDVNLWSDVYVFINNNYPDDPVSIGVATLDAINNAGFLNGDSDIPFESDFLTSMPLNLDYSGQNDTWLSFFYQPQGNGDEPEPDDSLTVEFYAPIKDEWKKVWAAEGQPLNPFTQVWIQVADTSYFHTGFRFRFMNYASLPKSQSFPSYDSDVDHWNVDYVYLDKGRSQSDTSIKDVSMITDLPSLLKTYESVPWRHFPSAYLTEIQPKLKISYRNNDITTRNVTRFLEIKDLLSGSAPYSRSGGAVNVEAGMKDEYEFIFNYPFDENNKDSAIFSVKSYLVTDEDDYKWNDTVTRYQVFNNYYAYDDGTAEAGYGLGGEGTSGAALAYQFKTYKEDTLRSVKMYFNRTLNNVSQVYFDLAVWDNNDENDHPGNLIYSMSGYRPEYYNELNKYYTYNFDTLLIVSDIFYVGWIQPNTVLLNVGFDRNNNNRNKIFYNLGQQWVSTSFDGSLMIRPVLGKETGWPVTVKKIIPDEVKVYPNPAADFIHIELPSVALNSAASSNYNIADNSSTSGNSMVSGNSRFTGNSTVMLYIYNLQGGLVYQSVITGDENIPVHQLIPGMYLIRIQIPGSGPYNTKLLITR